MLDKQVDTNLIPGWRVCAFDVNILSLTQEGEK